MNRESDSMRSLKQVSSRRVKLIGAVVVGMLLLLIVVLFMAPFREGIFRQLFPKEESSAAERISNEAIEAYKRRIQELEPVVEREPDNYEAHQEYAYALYVTRDNEKAKAAYQRVVALNTNDAEAYDHLGTLYRLDGQYDEAADAYNQAIIVNPKTKSGYVNLAHMYIYSMGRVDDGLAVFDQMLEQHPNDLDLLLMVAKTYENQGRGSDAQEFYQRMLTIDPQNVDALNAMHDAAGTMEH